MICYRGSRRRREWNVLAAASCRLDSSTSSDTTTLTRWLWTDSFVLKVTMDAPLIGVKDGDLAHYSSYCWKWVLTACFLLYWYWTMLIASTFIWSSQLYSFHIQFGKKTKSYTTCLLACCLFGYRPEGVWLYLTQPAKDQWVSGSFSWFQCNVIKFNLFTPPENREKWNKARRSLRLERHHEAHYHMDRGCRCSCRRWRFPESRWPKEGNIGPGLQIQMGTFQRISRSWLTLISNFRRFG